MHTVTPIIHMRITTAIDSISPYSGIRGSLQIDADKIALQAVEFYTDIYALLGNKYPAVLGG